ncbi:MAG: hypothetical protein C0432_06275 [Candidatus Puniceispirillum sp.]|nr:hypothetical protein [Candidatus Puniceispirillum sp.]
MKNFIWLISGSIIAQVLNFLASPILTRIYSPEEFGEYMLFLSIAGLFTATINGRYDMMIVSAEEKDLFSLIRVSLIISIIVSILSTITFFVINFRTDMIDLPVYTFLLFFSTISFYGLINIITAYNNRIEEYKLISQFTVIRSTIQNLGSILLGIMGMGYLGLAVSYVFGQFIGVRKQSKKLRIHFKDFKKLSTGNDLQILKKYINQPLYSLPSILINNLSYTILIIVIGKLYGVLEVGLYSIALRVLGLPLSLVSGNISKLVMKSGFEEIKNNSSIKLTFNRYFRILVLLSIPLFILISESSNYVDKIFGKEWNDSGLVINSLLFMFIARFITSSLSPLYILIGRQKIDFLLQILFLIVTLILSLVSYKMSFDFLTYINYINILYGSVYVIYLIYLFYFSKLRSEHI